MHGRQQCNQNCCLRLLHQQSQGHTVREACGCRTCRLCLLVQPAPFTCHNEPQSQHVHSKFSAGASDAHICWVCCVANSGQGESTWPAHLHNHWHAARCNCLTQTAAPAVTLHAGEQITCATLGCAILSINTVSNQDSDILCYISAFGENVGCGE